MASTSMSLQRLRIEADKAAAGADAAKQQVRSAKAALKSARKTFKAAKKMAKQKRKKIEAAQQKIDNAQLAGVPAESGGNRKPRVKHSQSAAQVAKAVITRMSVVRRPKPAAKHPHPVAGASPDAPPPPGAAAERTGPVETVQNT